jgi:hypothetical protein
LSSAIKDFSLISPIRQASTSISEDLDLDCVLLDYDFHSKSVSEKLGSTRTILNGGECGETTLKSTNEFQTHRRSSSLPTFEWVVPLPEPEDLDFDWCRYGVDIEYIPSNVSVPALQPGSGTTKKCWSKSGDEAETLPTSGRVMLGSKSMRY